MMGFLLVLCTTSSTEEAKRIAKKLLDQKLAACVNIVEKVDSSFWWRGKVERAEEALMLIKTTPELFDELAEAIKKEHSYTVPEIAGILATKVNEPYLRWLVSSVKRSHG